MGIDDNPPFEPTSDSLVPPTRNWIGYLLRFWMGVALPVRPLAYALSGLGLALFKYVIEATVIWGYTSQFFAPWDFLNPVLSIRAKTLDPAPDWVPWMLFVWSLPFLWIAVSMSVRRMADAGGSPWAGLMVLIPVVNLLMMPAMCLLPSASGERWSIRSLPSSDEGRAKSALAAVGGSLAFGASMMLLSVYLLSSYGASLFLGTPVVMGAAAAYLYNQPHPRNYRSSIGIALASVGLAMLTLLMFALEGVICIAMAAPLILPIGALGGVMGKAIADSTRRPSHDLLAVIAVLPMIAGVESLLSVPGEREVMTAVEIDAPPRVVWDNIVEFPDVTQPAAWYFRCGIACPQRARIIGRGIGATRYCEFTTGTFVEPITRWQPAHRLAFDVAAQPAPMFELTPYRHVHPPHLEGCLRSNRGEFLLAGLPGGRTRLEGRTWYEFDMAPRWYWTLWSDLLIHRIHQRVLWHIKQCSEGRQRGGP